MTTDVVIARAILMVFGLLVGSLVLASASTSAAELEPLPARGTFDSVKWRLASTTERGEACIRLRLAWPSGAGYGGSQCDGPLPGRRFAVVGEYVVHCPSGRTTVFGLIRGRAVTEVEVRQGRRRTSAALFERPGAEGPRRAWLVSVVSRRPLTIVAWDRDGRRVEDGVVRLGSARQRCGADAYFATGYVSMA
jgi:hypothetical protein